MKKIKRSLLVYCFVIFGLCLQSCTPTAVVGSTLAAGYFVSKGKKPQTILSDSLIFWSIKSKILRSEHESLAINTDLTVQEGNVYLLGNVASEEERNFIVQTARNTKGVRAVVEDLTVKDKTEFFGKRFAGFLKDNFITSQTEVSTFFSKNVRWSPFYIKTIDGKTYLIGSTKSDSERNRLVELAVMPVGVKRVVNYTIANEYYYN